MKKRVLLVTSKHPNGKRESDGGKTTVTSVIESLKEEYNLDILFVRRFSKDESHIDGVGTIFFEEIKNNSKNKFERRILNYKQVSNRILELEKGYDFIVIIHVSKAFGLERAPDRVLNKTILYPMFMSFAYKESGEIVPPLYDELEKNAMRAIKWFVCPSKFDKETIVSHYDLNNGSFYVIPRSMAEFINHSARNKRNGCTILSIGNIKERKQPLVLLNIFKKIKDQIHSLKLLFAGEIQDVDLYNRCLNFIQDNNLTESVSFLGAVSQKQIGKLIEESDINVCASNFETFGRCVFEGMYGGLPTVVFEKLTCVKEFVEQGKGIVFAVDESDFSRALIDLLIDEKKYVQFSNEAIEATKFLGFEKEKDTLLHVLKHIEDVI